MSEEFTKEDYDRLQRFRHLVRRTVGFQSRWNEDLGMGFVMLADFAEGAMNLYEVNDGPLWDLGLDVPEDEEAFGALATVIRWTTVVDEEVYFEKVLASIHRLDTEANRGRISPLLREAIRTLPQVWERTLNPTNEFLGYRKVADLTPPLRRTEGWTPIRELAEEWMREDVATGNMHTTWPPPESQLRPSDRYWVGVVYFCRLIQLARHTDQILNLLRINGLLIPWDSTEAPVHEA